MADAQGGNKVITGARATLQIGTKPIGIFTNVSCQLTYEVSPVYILGRMSPAELDYTSQAPVRVQCSGFMVLNNGPYDDSKIPVLDDLLTAPDISVTLHDRQSGQVLFTVENCRAEGFSTGVSARALEDLSITYVGLRVNDENHKVAEGPGALDLP